MYIVDRGDADRRPEARMAEHPGGYAEGVPPHGTGGSRGKFLSQTLIQTITWKHFFNVKIENKIA